MKHSISIIIPALNEATIIQQTIDHIFSLQYDGRFEVIVVDGSPHGETIHAVSNGGVKKLTSKKGRPGQMNRGASIALGEVLVFLHADTILPFGAFESISAAMEKKDVIGGAFDLGIQSDRRVFRIIEKAASIRSRITRVPYGDQAIFIRKEYFHALGGFREIPLMEDVELMTRIRRDGGRIQIISSKVKTSPRRWEKEGVLYCTLRNWALITLYSLGLPPERLARFYR